MRTVAPVAETKASACGIGSNQEVVAVKLCAWSVVVHVETGLSRIAWKNKVLHVVVRDQNVLMPVVVRVQPGVRVLLDQQHAIGMLIIVLMLIHSYSSVL